MKLHQLSPAPGSVSERKRVGRGHGSGHGKTAGKGQKAEGRAGHGIRIGFEGRQMPCKGGFETRSSTSPRPDARLLISWLNEFEDGAVVDAQAMIDAGLVNKLYDGD